MRDKTHSACHTLDTAGVSLTLQVQRIYAMRSFVQSHGLCRTSNAPTQSTFSDVVYWNESPCHSFHPANHRIIIKEEIEVPYGRQIHDSSSTAMLDDDDKDRNTDGV